MEGSTEYIDFLGANVKTEELINYVDYDAIVIVGCSLCPKSLGSASALANAIAAVKRIDSDFEKQVRMLNICIGVRREDKLKLIIKDVI